MRIAAALVLASAFVASGTGGGRAADIPPEQVVETVVAPAPAFQFVLTPYLWVASTNGTVTIDSARRPGESITADFHATFADAMEHLHGIPIVGAAEIRYGRFGLGFDVIYIPQSQSFTTPFRLFDGGSANLKQFMGQAVLTYRIYEDAVQWIDIGGGVRTYSFRTTLNLFLGLLPAETASNTFSWTDPIVAARYRLHFAPQWSLTLYGDVGGFDAGSRLTWQALGTIDYQITDAIELRLGYRHMAFDRREGRTELDVSMSGPILGVTFRF